MSAILPSYANRESVMCQTLTDKTNDAMTACVLFLVSFSARRYTKRTVMIPEIANGNLAEIMDKPNNPTKGLVRYIGTGLNEYPFITNDKGRKLPFKSLPVFQML